MVTFEIKFMLRLVVLMRVARGRLSQSNNNNYTFLLAYITWTIMWVQLHVLVLMSDRTDNERNLNLVLLAGNWVGMMNPARANSGTGDSKSTAMSNHIPFTAV